MALRPAALVALALVAVPSWASAQPDAKKPTEKAAATSPQGDPDKSGARKDPEGKTGISPYMEAVAKGERAFVAKDMEGARAAFQEAVQLDPTKTLGFFRLAESELAAGKLDDAASTLTTAQAKKGSPDLQAKVLFLAAEVLERQKKWAEAKDAWGKYAQFLGENAKAVGYAATATERQKQIDRRVKDEADYGAVKDRTAKREAERLKQAEDNAKKDALNNK
jgi:predicted Zn-dependent protease